MASLKPLLITAQDWWNMTTDAEWRQDNPEDCPSPFKPAGSPLLSVPGLTSPGSIMIDAAHTWHIGPSNCTSACGYLTRLLLPSGCVVFEGKVLSELRYGKDFVASGVVLLAKLKLFEGRSLDARLECAFKLFIIWCGKHKKNTNIHSFSKKSFKMQWTLGDSLEPLHSSGSCSFCSGATNL